MEESPEVSPHTQDPWTLTRERRGFSTEELRPPEAPTPRKLWLHAGRRPQRSLETLAASKRPQALDFTVAPWVRYQKREQERKK